MNGPYIRMSRAASTAKVILLSGIPAAGKSTYGRWLQTHKGYLSFDVENNALDSFGLTSQWNALFESNGLDTSFVRALDKSGRFVVLDWGFPPRCLPVVMALKQAGVEIWWFDGDRDAARQSFISRGTVPVECLDVQMRSIERAWPHLRAVFGDRIVNAIRSGPTYMTPEAVFDHMFGSQKRT
jgi:hypothetical protein